MFNKHWSECERTCDLFSSFFNPLYLSRQSCPAADRAVLRARQKLAGYELKQCRNAGKTVIGELKEMVKAQELDCQKTVSAD